MKFPLSAARLWALRLALLTAASCAVPVTGHAQASETDKTENSAMSGELLYEILLGEMNLRQGEPAAGFHSCSMQRANPTMCSCMTALLRLRCKPVRVTAR